LTNPRKQSGQAIIKDILDEIDRLTLYHTELAFSWIPGHQNIQGNEKADEAAKKAAQDPSVNSALPSTWKYATEIGPENENQSPRQKKLGRAMDQHQNDEDLAPPVKTPKIPDGNGLLCVCSKSKVRNNTSPD